MSLTRRSFLALSAATAGLGLAACSRGQDQQGDTADQQQDDSQAQQDQANAEEFKDLELDAKAWKYDKSSDCYYQLGVPYCLKPGSKAYESLALFVPAGYFDATAHGDTYECSVKDGGTVGQFKAGEAPVALPVNSVKLSAQACPTAFGSDGLLRYLSEGIVYVYAGFRGRSGGIESGSNDVYSGGAPWPVVDLKAAVRWVRYNKDKLPVDASRIFCFGAGMGAGACAVMGASGGSDAFTPYLDSIGAITHDAEGTAVSDEVAGVAAWCPVTSFDSADAAYEWMMGQFSTDGARADGTWTQLLSRDLAASYGDWVNQEGLMDEVGNQLTLDAVEDGAYLDGSYYTQVIDTIEASATDFFNRTSFPYTDTPTRMVSPLFPGDPNLAASGADEIDAAVSSSEDASDGSTSSDASASGVSQVQATVYDSASSYIATLNGDTRWLSYSSTRQTARVTGLWEFVSHCKQAERGVCAFDATDRSGTANQLFGVDDDTTLHFDRTAADLVASKADAYSAATGWDEEAAGQWAEDLAKEDALGSSMVTRVAMMSPLSFLVDKGTWTASSTPAAHWRINSGLFQTTTSLCTELNLVLALKHREGVSDVAFQTVWGKGFELAEQEGDPQDNLVAWILACCPAAQADAQ